MNTGPRVGETWKNRLTRQAWLIQRISNGEVLAKEDRWGGKTDWFPLDEWLAHFRPREYDAA
jgi:hypothetical protein